MSIKPVRHFNGLHLNFPGSTLCWWLAFLSISVVLSTSCQSTKFAFRNKADFREPETKKTAPEKATFPEPALPVANTPEVNSFRKYQSANTAKAQVPLTVNRLPETFLTQKTSSADFSNLPYSSEAVKKKAGDRVARTPENEPKVLTIAKIGFALSALGALSFGLAFVWLPFILLGILPGIMGLFISIAAADEISRKPDQFTGKGWAIGGIVLGLLYALVFGVLMLVLSEMSGGH